MPFLDHLEELRVRILKSAGALVVGMLLGLWMVSRFQLIVLLKKPIEPYLPTGKLVVLGPTEPVMIVLKLGFTVGLVLASPVIIYQIWAFLSPALYARERKALIPGLLILVVSMHDESLYAERVLRDPYVVGQAGTAGVQAVKAAGYPVTTTPIPSGLPQGQVIGESPQGNVAAGTPVTVWTSAGR